MIVQNKAIRSKSAIAMRVEAITSEKDWSDAKGNSLGLGDICDENLRKTVVGNVMKTWQRKGPELPKRDRPLAPMALISRLRLIGDKSLVASYPLHSLLHVTVRLETGILTQTTVHGGLGALQSCR